MDLELDNFSVFRMFNNCTVTSELFLSNFYNLLEIIFRGQPLHCSQSLPTVSLLDPDVNQSLLDRLVVSFVCISKRIKCFQVLNMRHF